MKHLRSGSRLHVRKSEEEIAFLKCWESSYDIDRLPAGACIRLLARVWPTNRALRGLRDIPSGDTQRSARALPRPAMRTDTRASVYAWKDRLTAQASASPAAIQGPEARPRGCQRQLYDLSPIPWHRFEISLRVTCRIWAQQVAGLA